MKKGCIVVINESHKLLPEQEKILNTNYKKVLFLTPPIKGWTIKEMSNIIENDIKPMINLGYDVVFVSPIPYLLLKLSEYCFKNNTSGKIRIFHNDKREKKEINGKIIHVVAKEGWQLI